MGCDFFDFGDFGVDLGVDFNDFCDLLLIWVVILVISVILVVICADFSDVGLMWVVILVISVIWGLIRVVIFVIWG